MVTTDADLAAYARQALTYAEKIAAEPRGSATEAEKRCAEFVQSRLKSMGIKDVRIESFIGLRSLWSLLALVFSLVLVGHAAFWLLRGPIGNLLALLISLVAFGLSGYVLWCKFSFRNYPLRSLLPHAPSQNVITIIPPTGEVHQRVVFAGHMDSHRAVFWFSTDLLLGIFAILCILSLYGVYLAILLYILAVLTGFSAFAWLGLAFGLIHFISWLTSLTADLSRFSPGANDNASAVGSLLALAERLAGQPLNHTEVWLAFTGCEESGCDGMLQLLKEYGSVLKGASFFDMDMVGIDGDLTYTHTEGNLRRKHITPGMDRLLQEVGRPFGLISASIPPGAFTEGGTLWEHGYNAACFTFHYPGSPIAPEWHRVTDTPDRLQISALDRIHRLAWALLQKIDQSPP